MAEWLECGARPMSLPAVRFRIPLGAEFSENDKLNVQCAETAAGLFALRGVEMTHEWTGPVTSR